MPASNHLEWFEIREFGGLYTAGANSMMPATKAQVMSGCHPQPGGGLRAFIRPSIFGADGMDRAGGGTTDGHNGRVTGLFVLPAITTSAARQSSIVYAMTVAPPMAQDLRSFAATLSTPNNPAFAVTGDIDIRCRWHVTLDSTAWTFLSTLDTSNFTGYEFGYKASGHLTFSWGDGSSIKTVDSTDTVPATSDSDPQRLFKVTLDVNNGSGGHDVKFFTALRGEATWTQLGSTVTTAGTTSIAAATADMHIGRRPGGSGVSISDRYFVWAEVRSGIDGTLVANPDATALTPGSTDPFTDSTGLVWTSSAPAVVYTGLNNRNGPTDWRLWRLSVHRASYTANFPDWVEITGDYTGAHTEGIGTPPGLPAFGAHQTGGASKLYLALALQGGLLSTDNGLYEIPVAAAGTSASLVSAASILNDGDGARSLAIHQSRLVTGHGRRLRFSAPGTADFTAAGSGFVTLSASGFGTGGLVSWIVPIPPGDLLVGTMDGKVYNVQGDLGDPVVRELGSWSGMIPHGAVNTPRGIFVILPSRGVMAINQDGSSDLISDDILPTTFHFPLPQPFNLGQLAGTERYLFAPNQHPGKEHRNGPLVYDHETRAWFTATHEDDAVLRNPQHCFVDGNFEHASVWVAASQPAKMIGYGDDDPFLLRYQTGGYGETGGTEQRASTWEWKSAPFREPGGRQLIIREIQIPTFAFNASSTLTVTVGNTTRTVNLPAGRSVQKILFKERGENLDITVKAKSNDASVEAPMIDAVRAGWRSGPLL